MIGTIISRKAAVVMVGRDAKACDPEIVELTKEAGESTSDEAIGEYIYSSDPETFQRMLEYALAEQKAKTIKASTQNQVQAMFKACQDMQAKADMLLARWEKQNDLDENDRGEDAGGKQAIATHLDAVSCSLEMALEQLYEILEG